MTHTPETPCVTAEVDDTRRRLLFGASVLPVVAGSGLTMAICDVGLSRRSGALLRHL